MALRINWQF